jgi:acyl-coenzyme A thioesterase PaaI-like protein
MIRLGCAVDGREAKARLYRAAHTLSILPPGAGRRCCFLFFLAFVDRDGVCCAIQKLGFEGAARIAVRMQGEDMEDLSRWPKVANVAEHVAEHACFGCGAANPIGLRMEFVSDGKRVGSLVRVPPTMAGWDRTVHGGILSTILDEIMGWSVIYLLRKIGVTRSISVEFLRPVQVEQPLTVIGSIIETPSDRQAVVRGEIFVDDDRPCVRATGRFAAMTTQAAVRLGVMSAEYEALFQPVLDQPPVGGESV